MRVQVSFPTTATTNAEAVGILDRMSGLMLTADERRWIVLKDDEYRVVVDVHSVHVARLVQMCHAVSDEGSLT